MKKVEMQKQIDFLQAERMKHVSQFGQIRDAIGGTIGMSVGIDGVSPDAVVRQILEKKNLINSSNDLLAAAKEAVRCLTQDVELTNFVDQLKNEIAKAEA
jgi:hypothetical protein